MLEKKNGNVRMKGCKSFTSEKYESCSIARNGSFLGLTVVAL